MNLKIHWEVYPAHGTPGLMLQRPIDVVDANPEFRARPPDIGELTFLRYGVKCHA